MNSDKSSTLIELLKNETATLVHNDYLLGLSKGIFDLQEWQFFLKQRYYASIPVFLTWLEAGIDKAIKVGYHDLAQELKRNFLDEIGKKHDGTDYPLGPHRLWRQKFYQVLGITDAELTSCIPLVGTQEVESTITQLIKHGSALEIAGAVLWWEYYVVEEFKLIEKGMYLSFPHLFKPQKLDSQELKREKLSAGLYIKHHIAHDYTRHFKDLKDVLLPFFQQTDDRQELLSGMQKIRNARKSFWDSLIAKRFGKRE